MERNLEKMSCFSHEACFLFFFFLVTCCLRRDTDLWAQVSCDLACSALFRSMILGTLFNSLFHLDCRIYQKHFFFLGKLFLGWMSQYMHVLNCRIPMSQHSKCFMCMSLPQPELFVTFPLSKVLPIHFVSCQIFLHPWKNIHFKDSNSCSGFYCS